MKVLELGKKRKNPVKPTVATVSSCSHTEETDMEGFSCERCKVMCSSMADLLHHVAETHEEGSMTNFLIYNITEDNKKMKEEMKNIQLALDFVLRDNQTLQDLNLETAVKLEAALRVIQKEKVDDNEEEYQTTEEDKVQIKPTTNNETKKEDWFVLDEYNSSEETDNVGSRESVLWIGTSLSDQHLDAKKLSLKTNTNVKKVSAFTIVAEDGKYKAEKNVEEVASEELEKNNHQVVVIEVGVNEVSDLDIRKAPHLLKQEMNEKMEKLHLLAVKMTMKYKGLKVVLVERVERIDSDQRANQARGADKAMWSWWEANGKPENIVIEKMKLKVKSKEERDEVFGRLGERTWKGKFNDGIHLRGKYGSKEFTHRASNLLRRVLGTKGKETRRFPEASKEEASEEETTRNKKEEERRKTEQKKKAVENNKRKKEERKKIANEKQKMDEERSRYYEREIREDNRRKEEYEKSQYERAKAKDKRLDEEKSRREEESRRRIRENRLKEEMRRGREERMRKSDERQERERTQDYEKRKVERDARHNKREQELRRQRMEPRDTFTGERRDKFRNQDRIQRRERENQMKEWRRTTRPRKEPYIRPMGRREEERETYYQIHYPPLQRAGNGRWGAYGAPRRWA